MKLVTRIFWTHFTLDKGSNRYRKERKQADFPPDVNVEACCAEIHAKFGELGRNDRKNPDGPDPLAPMSYAIITGHSSVDADFEKPLIESERATECALLSPEQLFAAQSRKPESKYEPRGRK